MIWQSGEKIMLRQMVSILNPSLFLQGQPERRPVPGNAIARHNQALAELKLLGPIGKTLNNAKLQDPDFRFYLQVKISLLKENENDQALKDSAELFKVAILAQSSFLKIEQTELRYHSSKQQDYYNFVADFLEKRFSTQENTNGKSQEEDSFILKNKSSIKRVPLEKFQEQLEAKLKEISLGIKTEAGKLALKEYTESLISLAAERELGLKLLYLFKKYNLTDFSVLKIISDMVIYLQDKNMRNMRGMLDLVNKNQEIFQQVGKIIGIPQSKATPDTYAKLLQYAALTQKHEKSYTQFLRLLKLLKDWEIFYQNLHSLRESYPASEYELPGEFTKEIPALAIYEQYQDYLKIFCGEINPVKPSMSYA